MGLDLVQPDVVCFGDERSQGDGGTPELLLIALRRRNYIRIDEPPSRGSRYQIARNTFDRCHFECVLCFELAHQ